MSRSGIGNVKAAIERKDWAEIIKLSGKNPRLAEWIKDNISAFRDRDSIILSLIDYVLFCGVRVDININIWHLFLRAIDCERMRKLLDIYELPQDINYKGENILHIASLYCKIDVIIVLLQKADLSLLFTKDNFGCKPWDDIRKNFWMNSQGMADLISVKPELCQYFSEWEMSHIRKILSLRELNLVKNFTEAVTEKNSLLSLMLSVVVQQTSLYLYGVSDK